MFSRIGSLVAIMVFCAVAQARPAQSQTLSLYTEEFPPFSMTVDGRITGVSTEVIEAVMKRAGIPYETKSYPWARTYKLAQSGETSLIYSISRRETREALFQWIGIIVPSVSSVYSLRNNTDIRIKTLADMKKYQIGTTLEDARETFLLNSGFTADDLQTTSGVDANVQNYRKLKKGRFDLWPMADAVAYYIVGQEGDDPSSMIRRVFRFEELSRSGYYVAASPDVPEGTVDAIRRALESFKQTTAYTNILAKWGLGQ